MKWYGVSTAFLLALVIAGSLRAAASESAVNMNDPDLQHAVQLYEQRKMAEAAAAFEIVVARYPTDAAAHEKLGASLVGRAAGQADPNAMRADRLYARKELLRAKELGDDSDLCRLLLTDLPEDGSFQPLSSKADVDAALREGEAAFSRADWPKAIAAYSRAWDLDPSQPAAAIYIGDTYYSMKNMDQAELWFARAIKADPNGETAYRYWGDALMVQGRMKEARAKYIEGIVAEPYSPATAVGMRKWLAANGLQWKTVPITLPPSPKVGKDGKVDIMIDPTTLNDPDGAAAWVVYLGERSAWMQEKFLAEYSAEKTYRHSLAEELSALTATVALALMPVDKGLHKPNASLALLGKLSQEGMLEAFTLLSHADAGLAKDYPAYRDAHRDKLIAYLDEYLVPPTP